MIEVAVLIPVLDRPANVEPLMRSLNRSICNTRLTAYFVASAHDQEQIEALFAARAHHFIVTGHRNRGDYARKINYGVQQTLEPWLFFGADDLRFTEGWADRALAAADRDDARVIGTVDLGNPLVTRGQHSTHTLVHRSYIEERGTIDQAGVALHEGYDHQFVDNEFIETAKHRGEFTMARDAVVEHLHPHWGKSRMDRTYALAVREMAADRALFLRRRRLWRGGRRTVRPAR